MQPSIDLILKEFTCSGIDMCQCGFKQVIRKLNTDELEKQENTMPNQVKSQKTAQKKKTVLSIKPKKSNVQDPTQDYQEMIAEAAYYKAEKREFVPGFEQEDWFEAENEILSMLKLH